MNIVFMGTPEFAVPCLERLINDKHNITAVFTQPDKPKGRGNILAASPVKIKAIEYKINVIQPTTLRSNETAQVINKLSPELIAVVAYGKILPAEIISIPKYGCINIHASLLPKYRGAAPIQWSVINGETETGVTSMLMDEGLDTGDILLTEKTAIGANETSGDLFQRLSQIGANVLSDTVLKIKQGTITPEKQNGNESNYAPMLTKALCPINWSEPAINVHNLIRGLNPFLSATTMLNKNIIKIHSSLLYENGHGKPGEIIENSDRLVVACGDGKSIEILTLQAEGKRALTANEFMRGHRIEKGTFFESFKVN